MAHNETRNGLNETERLPRTWSRSTVADGQWMQKNTLGPYRNSDWYLASAIDSLLDTSDALSAAIDAEVQARFNNDSDLSAWCTKLANSAEDLYDKLDDEVQARKDGDEAVGTAASAYTDAASAYVYKALSSTSSTLNGRIDGVSSTFDNFVTDYTQWQGGVNTDIGNLKIKTNQLSVDIKTSADKVREEFATGDEFLQNQIDALTRANDVVDVVDTSAKLNPYHGYITSGDIIKVLDGEDHMQEYWQFTGAQTAQDPQFNKFTRIGTLQPYYSVSEINSMFGNYYPKSELYTKTDVDSKLANKLDTSAQTISAMTTKTYSNTKYAETLNGYKLTAPVDGAGNNIVETYATKSQLGSYATKTYVNGTFASANNVFAKNQTSGKDQLNAAFENKLDASAAFEGHIQIYTPAGPVKYDLGDLWYQWGGSLPEEAKLDNNQEDVVVYTYPKNDRAYSARQYVGCIKRRKEIELYDHALQAWPNKTILPDFEHYPNTFFII